ncbi:MAG: N-acetylmuramoyl-L-alanine amidase, partial [Deferribacteraceae bacterium]|nr:N-acetylmuramoyl-L-alanine amidase [Deferribacteraceae bacterium]
LAEVGFLSNKNDYKKLTTQAYRKEIAKGINVGVQEYIKKYNK